MTYINPQPAYIPHGFERPYCQFSTLAVDQAKGLQHACLGWYRAEGWYDQMRVAAEALLVNAYRAVHPEARAAQAVAEAVLRGQYMDAARIELR